MPPSLWNIDQQTATLAVGSLTAQIALDAPERGLQGITLSGEPFEHASLLGVDDGDSSKQTAIRLEDAYVRGNDLVADYAFGTAGPKLRVYRNAASDPAAPDVVALSLTASLRTDLLVDERPLVYSRTAIPTETVQRLDAAGTVHTLHLTSEPTDFSNDETVATLLSCPGNLIYAEMAHPDDVRQSSLTRGQDGAAKLGHELFTERLEKGVIVRARVLGLLLPRNDDTISQIAERYRDFAAMQPPLGA
jgi:hypothetical protein